MEALSPRSTNLPMRPPAAINKTKVTSRTKQAGSAAINPDKIDENWQPPGELREPGPDADTYLIGNKLGRGGFAVCFKGTSKRTGETFALKVVKSYVSQKKQLDKFRTELQIHAKMDHPSIVEFHRAFAFGEYTYVVLELCPNGSLMDMVKYRKSLSLPEVRRYIIQLCGGVKYMHQRGVIHRDLKMGNLFIDSHMNIKIGDFGLAAVVLDDKERRQTVCGTPNYIAPEILGGSTGHGHKVDTWAIGIICYAMLIGTPPFASKSQPEIYEKLKQLQYEWKEDCQYFIPRQAKDLVTLCLNREAAERPGMDDIVEHEFFKMGAIAEELDPSCLRSTPPWLEHADPRGDKVRAGYGVDHTAICGASGVGKTLTGESRPSVGGNVNVSGMAKVHEENKAGRAPVIPMPEGVIYMNLPAAKEEFAATKEESNTVVRKRPLTKVRSRKEPPLTVNTDMNSLSRTLPESRLQKADPTSIVPSIAASDSPPTPPRPPYVQSFAAQQRERALPPRAPSRLMKQAGPAKGFCGKATKASYAPGHTETQTTSISQGGLCEPPIRPASRVTRSTSSRGIRDAQGKKPLSERRQDPECKSARGLQPAQAVSTIRSAHPSPSGRNKNCGEARIGDSASARRSPPSSDAVSTSVPDEVVDVCTRQPTCAQTGSVTTETDALKALPPSSPPQVKPMVIGIAESSTLMAGSSPTDVLRSLEEVYRDLSAKAAVPASPLNHCNGTPSNPHTVVEKWVDYTEKYGIGYVLSDGTAGIALRSSPDNVRSSSCVVVRNGKEHYARRFRKEEVQIVPQGQEALPVEFYEGAGGDGIREKHVRACDFGFAGQQSGEWIDGKEVVARLSAQAHEEYAAERVRLVGLLDKFGRYMSNLNSSNTEGIVEPQTQTFIKFYQRLGNVGIWGFGDGAFQFNFPDHTKLLLYRSSSDDGQRLLLDLYYLQPEDATYLAETGSMSEGAMEKRDSITRPVSQILYDDDDDDDDDADDEKYAKYQKIMRSNEVPAKLSWIQEVVGTWVREGGLGKTGEEKLAWTGLQDKASDRDKKSRMVWVTVGRDGGDGQVQKKPMAT